MGKDKICLCGEAFFTYMKGSREQKYCSPECWRKYTKDLDVIGIISGSLRVVEEIDPKYNAKGNPIRRVKCLCVCGNISVRTLTDMKRGTPKSCGCLQREKLLKIDRSKHGLINTPLYKVWIGMKGRCNNKNNFAWEYYGGRGVSVCDEWQKDFKRFYEWAMNNGYKKGLQIDKDIKGNGLLYSPETCCFVTRKRNMNTTRRTKYVLFGGERTTISNLSSTYGIKYSIILKRLKLGWSVERAVTTPAKK